MRNGKNIQIQLELEIEICRRISSQRVTKTSSINQKVFLRLQKILFMIIHVNWQFTPQ